MMSGSLGRIRHGECSADLQVCFRCDGPRGFTAAYQQPAGESPADIRRWHLERGWAEIGYHFVIRKSGDLEIGRSLEYQGAHCLGINDQSIGVCCSGMKATHVQTPLGSVEPASVTPV